jgi:hypothetical protein
MAAWLLLLHDYGPEAAPDDLAISDKRTGKEKAPVDRKIDSDKFPTSAVHCCAKWGEICNERRLLGYLDQLLMFALRASNQVVGSSNLSGRATKQ